MAGDQTRTADSAGPIRDPEARRVCSLAGIETARARVTTLKNLRDGLDISIKELENQRKKDKVVNKALMVARFTKATCDAFIGMAGTIAKAVIPGKGGEAAEKFADVYATANPIIEAVATADAGGKADWVKAGTSAAKEGVGLLTKNKGTQLLAKSAVVKVEVIRGAMNHDEEGVIKSGLTYAYDMNTTAAEMTGEKGEAVAAVMKVGKSAFEYNEQIGKAFDQLIDDDLESEERFHEAKANLVNQAKRLSKTIEELERSLAPLEKAPGAANRRLP